MEFKLSVRMDDEAFTEAPGYELTRLLLQVHRRVMDDGARSLWEPMVLRDSNGNRVGVAQIEREE